jgi:hypothetical protein
MHFPISYFEGYFCHRLGLLPASMEVDFFRLNNVLDVIASRRAIPAEEVLERWLESRKISNSESWRQLVGIPCIMGGLTALCGEFDHQSSGVESTMLQVCSMGEVASFPGGHYPPC